MSWIEKRVRPGCCVAVMSAVMVSGITGWAQTSADAARTGGTANISDDRPLQAGPQILSDTQGVDFTSYLRRLHIITQRNWVPLIPKAAKYPRLKEGVVGIRLVILPDGRIGSMKLESPSGDAAFDKAAWHAIKDEKQFPPLPSEFHGPLLELRVGFFYNTPAPPEPTGK